MLYIEAKGDAVNFYDEASVRDLMVRTIADIKGLNPTEVSASIDAVGDFHFELSSKFAEALLAGLEAAIGHALPAPADLQKSEFATMGALLALVLVALKIESRTIAS
jgi:hypothetical protein